MRQLLPTVDSDQALHAPLARPCCRSLCRGPRWQPTVCTAAVVSWPEARFHLFAERAQQGCSGSGCAQEAGRCTEEETSEPLEAHHPQGACQQSCGGSHRNAAGCSGTFGAGGCHTGQHPGPASGALCSTARPTSHCARQSRMSPSGPASGTVCATGGKCQAARMQAPCAERLGPLCIPHARHPTGLA